MNMKALRKVCLCCLGMVLTGAAQTLKDQNSPLPNPGDLLQRAIANEAKLASEQERYECRVHDETTELDSKGNVKRLRPRRRSSSLSTALRSIGPWRKTEKT